MSTYVHDTFESYALGTPLGSFGGYDKIGFGGGSIVSGGWNSSKALNTDQGVGISGIIPPIKSVSLGGYFFPGILFNFEQAVLFQARNQDTGLGSRILISVATEINGSLSMYSIDNTILCNTGSPGVGIGSSLSPFSIPPFFLRSREWIYIIITFNIGSWFDSGIERLTVGGSIAVNKTLYNQGTHNTPVGVAALPYPLPFTNQWNTEGLGGNAHKIDNLFINDTGDFGEEFFPIDKIPTRVSQVVTEYGQRLKTPRTNRVSQLAVEEMDKPSNRFTRVSQLVVEIMGRGNIVSGDGMKVREI